MKFRNLIFLLIIAAVLIAWFTKPSMDSFRSFYATEQRSDATPPVIETRDNFLYSLITVSHYSPVNITDSTGTGLEAVAMAKQEYLGLFGRFWKMK